MDFPDYYVSNLGNVKSVKKGRELILKPWTTPNSDYYTVSLCRDGKTQKIDIHRLVAKYFVPNPNNYPVVHHKDANKHNNTSDNLEWTTVRENIHRSYKTMGPDRNKRRCKLILLDGSEIEFESYPALLKYKYQHNLDFSDSSLNYHGKSRGYKFVKL